MKSCHIKTSLCLVLIQVALAFLSHYFTFFFLSPPTLFSGGRKKNPNNFGLDDIFQNNYFCCDFPSFQTSYQWCISKPSTNESTPFYPAIPHVQSGEHWHFAVGAHCPGAAISTKRPIPLPTFCILRMLQAAVIVHHYCRGQLIIPQGTIEFTVPTEE